MSGPRRDPRYPRYDDGLDDDGYPLSDDARQPYRLPYRHGSEEEAGDWQPQKLLDVTAAVIDRATHTITLSPHCDSPIETHLGAAIIMQFAAAQVPLKLATMIDLRSTPDELLLVPQYAWHFYRSDWALVNPKRANALLIECDGKDFHSSPQQREHDLKKDSTARARGYRTMRFTGSEIHRDPDVCARRILAEVYSL